MADLQTDPRPGDLVDELTLQRALLAEYLERFVDGVPLPADDIARLFDWLESIGRQVERINKILTNSALTAAEVGLLQAVLADLLRRYLPEEHRAAFLAELEQTLGHNEILGELLPQSQRATIDAEEAGTIFDILAASGAFGGLTG